MAATNPLRVSDLIKKYGWTIMPYLSNLGVQLLAEAQVLFVDSGHTNASDADDGEHGHSFTRPLATWDYAIGLCTAGEKSVILLAPNHNENIGNTQIDNDIADVITIGVGDGPNKPRFDFDNANASIDVGGNNVVIRNVNFLPSTGSVLIGVHVESGVTGFKLADCTFMIGEDGSGADEFVKAVELTSGNHDSVFENVTILAHASAAQATHGIHVAAASDRLTFRNVIIDGPYATGGIVEAAAGVNHIVEDCSIDTSGTNFSFHGSSTFAKYTRNVDAGVDSEESEPLIEVARGTGNYPTGIIDNSIFAYLMGKGGTAQASTFNNTTDSLEAIRDAVDAIDNTTNLNTAVPADPTARSVQDILEKDTSSNFDRSTDSLEAIADALAAGTGCTAAIDADSLDKLVGTSDTDQAYPASLVSHSILSSIMASDGNPAGYDRATDSLEAIADAIAAITDNVTTAVSQTPTARSLQDILEKNASGGFSAATDSLEAIADRLIDANVDKLTSAADGTGNYPASVVQDSVIAMILSKSANPVATSYDNQTDSLEAISDALSAAIGSPSAGSALDILKKLYYTADGTDAYPATVANDSTLAKIMASDNPATSASFDNTTDSLEAIRDHLDGTTVLGGINLDHLCLTTTGVAADGELDQHIVAGTILGHIMAVDADPSNYNASTDSLQGISDKIGTIVNAGGTATIGGVFGDFANSPLVTRCANIQTEVDKIGTVVNAGGTATIGAILGDFANSDLVTRIGNLQTDADRWGTLVNAGGTAELGAMLGDFANSTLVSRLNTIDSIGDMGRQCTKATGVALTGGDVNVFTVATGPVKITGLFMIIGTAVDAACKAGFTATPTAGSETDLTPIDASGVELNAAADAGDIVYSELDNTIMIVANTDGGAMPKVPDYWQIVPIGAINLALQNSDPTAGAADIYVQWEPLAPGATLTAT